MIPEDLRYSPDHEWIRPDDSGNARVGITDYAQNSLGDIVFVQLPDPGSVVAQGDSIGEVESTKSVSDILAPVAGTIVSRNDALENQPELVNTDPYGDGWMFEIELSDPAEASDLLDSDAYAAEIGES